MRITNGQMPLPRNNRRLKNLKSSKYFLRVHPHLLDIEKTYNIAFDIKLNLRRKTRIEAEGHMTDPPKESCYSNVVSIDLVKLALLLGVLNSMKANAADCVTEI